MTSFYRCRYFRIQELVDRATFSQFGALSWMFLRREALISLDNIREYFSRPVLVNDWMFGGAFQYRGFRPRSYAECSDYSQHRFGNAFDLDVQGLSAEEVRCEILRKKDEEPFRLITCLEKDVSWVHFDCRNIDNRILLVNPIR